MKAKLALVILLLAAAACAQNRWLAIDSSLTGEKLEALVVLPPGYEEDGRRYPVLYFLHGWQSSPLNLSLLLDWDQLLAGLCHEGTMRPFILVLPSSGDGGESWYSDYQDGRAYERYFLEELIPAVDRSFRTIASCQGRGIGGFSMGGFGAFKLLAKHPYAFGSASSVSGMLSLETFTLGWSLLPLRVFSYTFRHLYEDVFGPSVADWRRHDPKTLLAGLERTLPEVFAQRSFFMAVGSKDEFLAADQADEVAEFFSAVGADYTYQKVPGGRHNFFFLSSRLEAVFRFHSEIFARSSRHLLSYNANGKSRIAR